MVKLVAYGWSAWQSLPAGRDQTDAALADAARPGWEAMLAEQRSYLDDFWDRGRRRDRRRRPDAAGACGSPCSMSLQAGARSESRAIAAKGLTGSGLRRTRVLGHRDVRPAGAHLHARRARPPMCCAGAAPILPQARQRAQQLGSRARRCPGGRSAARNAPVTGRPGRRRSTSTPTSPRRSCARSGDQRRGLRAQRGLELLVESARLWRSLGHFDAEGIFRIDGVTGPDEYGAVADNNVYTNLMAQHNLTSAVEAAVATSTWRESSASRGRAGGVA